MLPLLLAAAVAAASPSPTPCPSDLAVTNPRLKVVRARDVNYDNYIVTVDIANRGRLNQNDGIDQRLDVVKDGKVIGSQPIPPLTAQATYPAAFRIQLPHEKKHEALALTFHYVLNDKRTARENCSSDNDLLTVTLR